MERMDQSPEKQKLDPNAKIFSPINAARYLGVSKPYFYKKVAKKVDRVTIDGFPWFTRESLDRFLSERLERGTDE